jgi:hypothetical protein
VGSVGREYETAQVGLREIELRQRSAPRDIDLSARPIV